MNKINVCIWNEFRHEKNDEQVKSIYPDGIHMELSKRLGVNKNFNISTAVLDDCQNGLSDELLNSTDVLIWWGHMAHEEVSEEIVDKVYERIMNGMGLIVLHSAHGSKIFSKLCGTNSGNLKWREEGEKERIWVMNHNHPITEGINEFIELPKEEMYGEYFNIPTPDELLFVSWFEGGEIFRSGFTYNRGLGKVFYFRPGHERFPTYKNDDIIKVIANGIHYVASKNIIKPIIGNTKPFENN